MFLLQNLFSWDLFHKLLNASESAIHEAAVLFNPLVTSSDVPETAIIFICALYRLYNYCDTKISFD